ncbi:Uncharacterised protein [uncultured archaeon]|nr:Uncharacterised protein [uncultured archaeon]
MGMKKQVFLSFSAEDLLQVRGLRLLKDNPNLELDFYDESIREVIDSKDADYIKRVIREKIRRSSVTVCLIGETTYKSKWVDWELETSDQEGNKIIVMALKGIDSAVLPKFAKENDMTFYEWNPELFAKLI